MGVAEIKTESSVRNYYPRVISQLSGGRLITLDHFDHRRENILFLLEWILSLDTDLHSLHATLMPKLLSLDL